MSRASNSKQNEDKIFMQRCLQLAYHAIDTAAPNPMVGAVVVHQGRIIGEGWHRKAGQPHAEPNAIRSVKNQELLKESTLYVSLEPCSHYGKTPPCADLIIEKGIRRVVVGCEDPFPEVSGRGIRKLKDAGIEVVVGVEREACQALNRQFFTYHLKQRPYILLKWAQSADGYIDCLRDSWDSPKLTVSDDYTSLLVHKLRHESDAIMVGRRTAQLDRPSLSVRNWPSQRKPLRVVLDRAGLLGPEVLGAQQAQPTLVFTASITKREDNIEWVAGCQPEEIMQELYRRGIQRLLVEGGSQVHQSLLDLGLWDEIQIETAPIIVGEGVHAPQLDPSIARVGNEYWVYSHQVGCHGHQIMHIIRK